MRVKMNRRVLLILIGLFGLTACSSSMTPTAQPPDSVQPTPTIQQVINYPQPSISKINVEVFRQAAGLPASEEPFSVSIESLSKSNPLASLDCLTIAEPNALLGALEPPYPLVTCTAETHVDQGLYRLPKVPSTGSRSK